MRVLNQLSRREVLKAAGIAGVAAALGGVAPAMGNERRGERKRLLRVAHLTDMHVEPERRAGEGWASCLRHVRELKDKPDLIITGGDHVFDSFEADETRTRT